jgi:hypothetical protein
LLFALYYAVNPSVDDERMIVIDEALEQELASMFSQGNQRPPTPSELEQMIEAWVLNELLYREGLALGLDRGDPMMRELVISKMRALVRNSVVTVNPSEAEL